MPKMIFFFIVTVVYFQLFGLDSVLGPSAGATFSSVHELNARPAKTTNKRDAITFFILLGLLVVFIRLKTVMQN